ncbi:MAG: hypothetical protein ACHQE6_02235 [Solirubrobacterales bacterium]
MADRGGRERRDLGEVVRDLSPEVLREIVASAADRHDDVERHVRLAAAREEGDLAELRAEVDRGLRTRRFLGYRESSEWARAARPVVEELRSVAVSSPSRDLVVLVERAVGHVVKVIMHADDSNGTIGDLARELLDVHAQACDAGVADPVKLAAWMVRFSCDDQDFFEVDPVRYAGALGERGLLAYRRAIDERGDGERVFPVHWAHERLAVLDGDGEAIVALLGGDLSAPHQFIRVSEAMGELGREEEVLLWAKRGIAETDGWQVAQLYDLACGVYERRSAPLEDPAFAPRGARADGLGEHLFALASRGRHGGSMGYRARRGTPGAARARPRRARRRAARRRRRRRGVPRYPADGGRGTALRRGLGPQPGASLVGERRTIDRDFAVLSVLGCVGKSGFKLCGA